MSPGVSEADEKAMSIKKKFRLTFFDLILFLSVLQGK